MKWRLVVALVGGAMLASCDQPQTDTKVAAPDEARSSPSASAEPAATVAVKVPPEPSPAPARFRALGNEPFWSVAVADRKLTYSTPENIEGITIEATGMSGDGSESLAVWTGDLQGRALRLEIEPGTCSDGMSDQVYRYKASLTLDGHTERGCARKL
ncbi:MAG TPA: hypothetical protein VHG29_09545 [Novosphingobium sp.]|nr:hypothetical protein [Novosphingobium sp.]